MIMLNLKRLFAILKNKKGFVMAEFAITLPLLILLIVAMLNLLFILKGTQDKNKFSENQATDYIMASEANEIIRRITRDARSAVEVELLKSNERQDIIFTFHANTYDKNNDYGIVDTLDTRRYILYAKDSAEKIYRVYVHRQYVLTPTSPITGNDGNVRNDIPGDTSVDELKFTIRNENILHISLKIRNVRTDRIFSVNTSVYMPACEKIKGF